MRTILIADVKVGFFHRDVLLVNDREMDQLRELVADEQRLSHGQLEAITMMTNHLGPGMRYQTTTRVHVTGIGDG